MNKILWSTLVQWGGKALQVLMGIITVRLLTQSLGPEAYGTYGKISEFSLFFATVANLGIFGSVVRKIAEAPQDGRWIGNALLLRLVTAGIFFGTGISYALLFIDDPLFLAGTLLFMSSLLLDYLTSVCDGVLQAHYQMGRATLALLLGRFTNMGLVFLMAQNLTNPSATFFFIAPLLGATVTLALTFYFVQKQVRIQWKPEAKQMKALLWTSLPFGIINILNSLYFRFIPSALLAKIISDELYGLYDLSLSIATMVSLLSTLFMFSVLPQLRHHLQAGELKQSRALYKKASQFLAMGAIGVIGLGTWLAPLALSLVSSKDFLNPHYGFILPFLLILAGVSYFYDLNFLTLFALNKEKEWLKQEAKVLMFSLILFGLAHQQLPTTHQQIIGILGTAIFAEAAMALWGRQKVKLSFH